MPKPLFLTPLRFGIKAVRTMPATAFTTVTPFEEVPGGKYPIPLGCPVVISFFKGNVFSHSWKGLGRSLRFQK